MSEVYVQNYTIPSARLGRDNPLPDIKNNTYIHAGIEITPAVTEEEREYIGAGMINTLLPYTVQDNYDRCCKEKVYQAVIVENQYLRAVFLPQLGGRLWSLIDKEKGKELLYCNPVFQPGNLALRNAWFSGGVEFNVSVKGHNPLTCSPIFAKKLHMADGSEGVRLYEYERIRGVVYSLDAWLPRDSRMLYIRPRIENRTGRGIWMYWWSNIAIPKTEYTRVIVPADEMFINYFENDHYTLDSVKNVPYAFGLDMSYPAQMQRSLDFFFKIPHPHRKWIAAVDGDGYGLVQCSTRELKGRKLFVWGEGAGGKNWNRFLSNGTNEGYIEIQAGLSRTQLEHIPMPSNATWSWVEAYGAVETTQVHDSWQEARQKVEAALDKRFPDSMEQTLEQQRKLQAQAGEILTYGSGWGALETLIREQAQEIPLSDTCVFPLETLSNAQKEWVTLLQEGYLPEPDVLEEPKGYLVDEKWRIRLKKAMKTTENRHWYSHMQLGLMEYAAGNVDAAREQMELSLACKENPWAARNLAMLWKNEYGNPDRAEAYICRALKQVPICRGILLEAAVILRAQGHSRAWLDMYLGLPEPLQQDGRLKFNTALAYMEQGEYKKATEYLNRDLEMPDIKEGDTAISDVWRELYSKIVAQELQITDPEEAQYVADERYPLGLLDFRIH